MHDLYFYRILIPLLGNSDIWTCKNKIANLQDVFKKLCLNAGLLKKNFVLIRKINSLCPRILHKPH
jgi:hypothetical protein